LSGFVGVKQVESLFDAHKNPKPNQLVSDFSHHKDRSMDPELIVIKPVVRFFMYLYR
jgi:hypothetical protein